MRNTVEERNLERWRSIGGGRVYIKLGCAVRYRLEDIEAFEKAGTHARPTNGNDLLVKASRPR